MLTLEKLSKQCEYCGINKDACPIFNFMKRFSADIENNLLVSNIFDNFFSDIGCKLFSNCNEVLFHDKNQCVLFR